MIFRMRRQNRAVISQVARTLRLGRVNLANEEWHHEMRRASIVGLYDASMADFRRFRR